MSTVLLKEVFFYYTFLISRLFLLPLSVLSCLETGQTVKKKVFEFKFVKKLINLSKKVAGPFSIFYIAKNAFNKVTH
jgi:hypothetical protein